MILMFAALITDRVAPDHVFVTALAFCMVTGIVDMKEGLKGFANEGVLTVMVRNYSMRMLTHTHTQYIVINSPCQYSLLLYYCISAPAGAFRRGPRPDHDRCDRLVHWQATRSAQKQRQRTASIGVVRLLRVGILEQHPDCGAHDPDRPAMGEDHPH